VRPWIQSPVLQKRKIKRKEGRKKGKKRKKN
jgi:hypothetical protein